MWVVVGLGNPGARYAETRHNLGFRLVDAFSRDLNPSWTEYRNFAAAIVSVESQHLALVKPRTYMNSSGCAVRDALARFDAGTERLLVAVDDVNLALGRIRIRREGSDGGHNGLLSILQVLGTGGFPRLRMGIGPPPPDGDLVDFVLAPFASGQQEAVSEMICRAAEAVRVVLVGDIDAAMNRFNAV